MFNSQGNVETIWCRVMAGRVVSRTCIVSPSSFLAKQKPIIPAGSDEPVLIAVITSTPLFPKLNNGTIKSDIDGPPI